MLGRHVGALREPDALGQRRDRRLRQKRVGTELGAFRLAWLWFRNAQLRRVVKALLRREGAPPLDLILAELKGCLDGPGAYWKSVKRQKALGA